MRPAVPVFIAILALFLASSSLPPALAQTVTEPILIVDITETEMRVNSSYSKPMTVTYNGTAEMVKPIYMVGDITVTLSAVVGTGYQASVEPSAMTFTKSETQLFVIRILLPAGLTDNMTMVNLTAVAESIVGRSVKEDSAVLILEHDNSCEDGTDCRDDGDGDGNDGNDQAPKPKI